MLAYIFNADILCEECGRDVRRRLNESALLAYHGDPHADDSDPSNPDLIAALGFDPEDEHAYDSDDYPKGPDGDGGGEADSPQHCGMCGLFLNNPLTDDGREYVIDLLIDHVFDNRGDHAVLETWLDAYRETFDDAEIGRMFLETIRVRLTHAYTR